MAIERHRKIQILVLCVIVSIILLLLWWSSFDQISDIINFSEEYDGKIVRITGKTHGAISIPFVGSIYKLSDGSAGIWVLSKIDSTSNSKIIFIKGVVRKEVDLKEIGSEELKIFQLFKDKLSEVKAGPVIIERQRKSLFSSLKLQRRK